MTYKQFKRRIESIKLLRNSTNKVNKALTEALTIKDSNGKFYNNIYIDGYSSPIEDSLVSDLVEDIFEYNLLQGMKRKESDFEKEAIEYIIYENDYCENETSTIPQYNNKTKEQTYGAHKIVFILNDVEYDCTLYNMYLEIVGLLNPETSDSFNITS
jgi:hypothetical protein